MTRLHWIVSGRVQGIGYRWFVRQSAEKLGVSGWVRNLEDGSVEGEAQAAEETVSRFVALLKSGHPFARVDRLVEKKIASRKEDAVFEIR